MMNSATKYGLIPPGSHLEVKSLYRNGDAIVLFDTETSAKEWLQLQMVDNKQYYKVVSVAIVMDEKQAVLKEVKE